VQNCTALYCTHSTALSALSVQDTLLDPGTKLREFEFQPAEKSPA